jgi:hypothetical protein
MIPLQEEIFAATKKLKSSDLPFATIWKTGKLYGFNFDEKPLGYSIKEYGIRRTVVAILRNENGQILLETK